MIEKRIHRSVCRASLKTQARKCAMSWSAIVRSLNSSERARPAAPAQRLRR
jgi:hypothetical protein